MPVEMVRRQVQHHRDIAVQALHQVELIGRELQHIDRVGMQRRKVQHAGADIAADAHIASGFLEDVADQRGGGRLAIGARDADDFRTAALRQRLHGAGKQFHVADHRHAGHLRHAHEAVRLRELVGNARREDERGKRLPVALVDVRQGDARRFGLGARLLVIVPRMDARAAGLQGQRCAETCAAQAVHSNVSSSVFGNPDHRARFTSASGWRGPRGRTGQRESRTGRRHASPASSSSGSDGAAAPSGRCVCPPRSGAW